MRFLAQAGKDLQESLRQLMGQYTHSGEGWNDQVRQEFDASYMQAYDSAVRSMAKAIDGIASLIAQAEREIP